MRVDVDDTGHQGQTRRRRPVPVGVAPDLADRRDPPLLDRDIGPPRLTPEPVDDRRPADQKIIHANLLPNAAGGV